jgi:hypothetical protein
MGIWGAPSADHNTGRGVSPANVKYVSRPQAVVMFLNLVPDIHPRRHLALPPPQNSQLLALT